MKTAKRIVKAVNLNKVKLVVLISYVILFILSLGLLVSATSIYVDTELALSQIKVDFLSGILVYQPSNTSNLVELQIQFSVNNPARLSSLNFIEIKAPKIWLVENETYSYQELPVAFVKGVDATIKPQKNSTFTVIHSIDLSSLGSAISTQVINHFQNQTDKDLVIEDYILSLFMQAVVKIRYRKLAVPFSGDIAPIVVTTKKS